jgi:hypothetical protein
MLRAPPVRQRKRSSRLKTLRSLKLQYYYQTTIRGYSRFSNAGENMAIDEKAAAEQIMTAVRAAAPGRGVGAGAGAGAGAMAMPGDFCTIWPQAKPVLEFVAGIAAFIPGVGTVAGGVLKGLIAVGDQISGQVCKK